MAHLLGLPNELLHHILTEVNADDLGALARTCRQLNEYIKNNRLLFRDQYLKTFDDPSLCPAHEDIAWEQQLPKLVTLQKMLESHDSDVKTSNFDFITTTLLFLVTTARPPSSSSSSSAAAAAAASPARNLPFLTCHFQRPSNIDTLLCRSALFARAGSATQYPADTAGARLRSAQLHCLYGIPVEAAGRRENATHPYARAHVYDLRNYSGRTLWGPFLADGSLRVDWEMVEAIMVVLGFNLRRFSERTNGVFKPLWNTPFGGCTPGSFVSPAPIGEMVPRELELPLDARDPYGISGTWMRVVCFLDYNDLYTFNFSSDDVQPGEPRKPIDTEEAIRLILLRLRVTEIEQPGESEGQGLPIVHFNGVSRSLHASWDPDANSRIRGSVRLTPEGEVRWTTISIFYGGEERWRSEGVQVGGVRSARGVLGTWFDKDYDIHGPAGPTAFWKLTDELVDDKLNPPAGRNE